MITDYIAYPWPRGVDVASVLQAVLPFLTQKLLSDLQSSLTTLFGDDVQNSTAMPSESKHKVDVRNAVKDFLEGAMFSEESGDSLLQRREGAVTPEQVIVQAKAACDVLPSGDSLSSIAEAVADGFLKQIISLI